MFTFSCVRQTRGDLFLTKMLIIQQLILFFQDDMITTSGQGEARVSVGGGRKANGNVGLITLNHDLHQARTFDIHFINVNHVFPHQTN